MTQAMKFVFALVLVLAVGLGVAWAAGSDKDASYFDRSVARVHSGSTFVDVSAAVYTSYVTLLTIEPPNVAMSHCQVHLDLDGGDDAQSFAVGYTSETIRFAIGRKIQGQWRIDTERQSATVAGTAAANRMVTLDIGIVGPDEDVRVYVLVSTEQTDIEIPYVCEYFAPERATFTDVTN